jgi:hypothetical protein
LNAAVFAAAYFNSRYVYLAFCCTVKVKKFFDELFK